MQMSTPLKDHEHYKLEVEGQGSSRALVRKRRVKQCKHYNTSREKTQQRLSSGKVSGTSSQE